MDTVIIPTHEKEPEVMPVSAPQVRSPRMGRWLLLIGTLALVCIVASRGIGKGEFEYNVDEAQHAVTGLFVADAIRDLPLHHPVQYAYRYYAQYPAVAILHWPPLFYVVEGISFIALGASGFSARLTVMLFTLLMLWQWFLLVEEMQDSYTASISTAILGLLPMMLLFEKTVMLEIPSLALGIAAVRYWVRYLDKGRSPDLYIFSLWLSAALLCKQTSVYLLVFCALSAIAGRKWALVFRREMLLAILIVVVLAGPFFAIMWLFQRRAVAHDLGSHTIRGLERATYYIYSFPELFSPAFLAVAAFGLLWAKRWSNSWHTTLMLCWIIAGYLTFSFFGQREPRFAIYWFPPVVYFAAGLLTQFFHAPRLRVAMRTVAVIVVGTLSVSAWAQERPYISGYKDAAAKLVNTYHAGIVLFDGRVPGNFVFYMRSLDPQRRFLVLRKALYADDIRPGESSEELLHSPQELTEMFHQDGIRFVVVSENIPLRFDSQRMLRELLQTDQFQLLGRFPISSNDPAWKNESLLLYENKQWTPPLGKELRIRMLTLPHDIVVPIEQFGFGKW
jgi:hypothetical protein